MRTRSLVALLALCAALLAAGCGKEAPPQAPTTNGVDLLEADQILERAIAALDNASSYRISGGGDSGLGLFELDLLYVGHDVAGTITTDGVAEEVIVVDGNGYLRGDHEMWTTYLSATMPPEAIPATLAVIADKYVLIPGGTSGALAPDPHTFLNPAGGFTKGETAVVEGVQAIGLVDEEGSTLYVGMVGEPYPLQIVGPDDTGTLRFFDFNAQATVEPPLESVSLVGVFD